jgi:hypothetical protein
MAKVYKREIRHARYTPATNRFPAEIARLPRLHNLSAMTHMRRALTWMRLALAALAERPAQKRQIERRVEMLRRDMFRRAAARTGAW